MPEIYRQLRGISSDRPVGLGPNKVLSVPDAIGIAIEKWMQDKHGIQQELLGGVPAQTAGLPLRDVVAPDADAATGVGAGAGALESRVPDRDFIGACPDCGSQLAFIEGCAKCHVCGFSECG